MKSLIFTTLSLFLIGIISICFNVNSKAQNITPKYSLNINNIEMVLSVADTQQTRVQGLSGVKSLPENSAKLFVFDESDTYGIWMKDMLFPLDIIWLDDKSEIVHIEKNVSPDTFPKVFIPPQKSLYVIEVNAGFSDKNHLMVGNVLGLHKK